MTAVTEFVGRYHAAGWRTLPVHRPGAEPGSCTCGRPDCDKPGKHPDPRHWPAGSADPAAFEGRNVGVLLGPASGNLADVDLDCVEALLAAPHLLPPTPAAFGRGTAVTHHLYTLADGAAGFAKLTDPILPGAEATVVELRWPNADDDGRPKAVQTVFPPSLHYKGKELAWARDGAPAAAPGADLAAAVRRIGAAVLVARYTKPKARHDLVLLLANLGVRAGWADDEVVVRFIAAVFAAMKDQDKLEKVLRGEGPNAVADARNRLRDGKPMTGLPALAKMLDPALGAAEAEAVVARVRDWLGLPDRDPPKPAPGGAKPAGGGGAARYTPLPPWRPFPTKHLPAAVRAFVASVAAAMRCDPTFVALPALAVCGGMIGMTRTVRLKASWCEPAVIWAVVVGDSGTLKTPPYKRAVAPVIALQVAALKAHLRDVAARHLGLTLDKELQQADWAGTLTPDTVRYAALDAEVPLRAWLGLAAELEAAELTGVAEIEFAALPCVAWAATRGVGIDRTAWQALAADADAVRARLREALDAAAPDGATLFGARNWDSPDDVKAALAAVGVGLEATDDDALAAVAHPLAGFVRDYRSAARLATTYGRDWLRHVAPDGRVYATWKQIGAGASGRMSCKGPNLPQLPRDARYRRCFAAPPGRALVKADYSQMELRVAAKVARDKRMLEAYKTGEDLHTLTAKALLGKAEVTKADRQLAKAVNFGLLYGQGADGLRRYARAGYGVELTEAEAVRHRETFFRTYPGLRAWHRSVGDSAMDTRTLAGRRRLGVTRYTEKRNTPIQGGRTG